MGWRVGGCPGGSEQSAKRALRSMHVSHEALYDATVSVAYALVSEEVLYNELRLALHERGFPKAYDLILGWKGAVTR